MHRFANRPVTVHDTLHWDVLALWAGVLDGLRRCRQRGRSPASASTRGRSTTGCSTRDGRLLGNPVHYRDRAYRRGRRRRWPTVLAPASCTRRPACRCCRSTRSSSSLRRADRGARGCGARAAHPRPVRLLADRRAGHRADQRVDHRAAGRARRERGRRAVRSARRCGADLFPPLREPGDAARHRPAVGRRCRGRRP